MKVSIRPDNTTSGSGSVNFGLVALADETLQNGIYARVTGGGEMRFQTFSGGSSVVDGGQSTKGGGNLSTVYTFSLAGTYVDTTNDGINNVVELFYNIEGGSYSGVGITRTFAVLIMQG